MALGNCLRRAGEGESDKGRWEPGRSKMSWTQICAAMVFAIAFTCIAQDGRPAPGDASRTPKAAEAAGSVPQSKLKKVAGADGDRKKELSDESTRLLAMAVALKAEVDKTNKDMLSINVIRKADEVERLARTVKERIKQASGPGSK
jgi:hypothetical protein